MTTYETGNPVPSTDVRDLLDNAHNFDNFSNGQLDAYADRFGVNRKSLAGMRNDFAAFLASSGFELPALEYVDSSPLLVDRPTQLIFRTGFPDTLYGVKSTETFPITLTGTWATDETKLVVRSDGDLRQDLSDASGASLVGFGVGTVADELSALGGMFVSLSEDTGSEMVGYSAAITYPAGTVGAEIKSLWDRSAYFSAAPNSVSPLELGIVIGDQRYDAETIGAGSILIGGWKTAAGQYNRLPGTRNLRAIFGGYDNEITAGTGGDDGGLACAIFASYHSEIMGATTHASIVGGSNHKMVGDYSTFFGGTLNESVIGSDFALTTGLRAKTRWGGSHTMGMGFSAAGDMQAVRATLRATTTNATPTEVLTTSGASSRLSTVDNSAMVFDILITGRRIDSGTESAAYRITGMVKRGAGVATTALVGTPTITVIAEDDVTWNVGVAASTSSGVLLVTVTGATGKTVRWGGRIDTAEVSF